MNKRASIFDDAAELDLGAFKPETGPAPEPDKEKLKEISERSNFPSRQAAKPRPTPIRKEQRRYRTGRNVQLNIKGTAEAVAEFNAICAAQNWVGGETLERALAALKRELSVKA